MREGWHVARSSEGSQAREGQQDRAQHKGSKGASGSARLYGSTEVVAWQAEECRGAEAPSAEGWGYRTAQEAEGGGRRLRGAGIAAQRRA